jgi:hypothetical protein
VDPREKCWQIVAFKDQKLHTTGLLWLRSNTHPSRYIILLDWIEEHSARKKKDNLFFKNLQATPPKFRITYIKLCIEDDLHTHTHTQRKLQIRSVTKKAQKRNVVLNMFVIFKDMRHWGNPKKKLQVLGWVLHTFKGLDYLQQ